jgi:dipeptidyl aminopeptidase/acylaminoacyl peptidase
MHQGSRNNLIGPHPDADLARRMSSELQVTAQTPPTFLFHTNEDEMVSPENSVAFYLALLKAGVPAEMHIYQTGVHGVDLAQDVAGTSDWPARCKAWMELRGLLRSGGGK